MKKIEAIIPPASVSTVRAELERRGVYGRFTLTDVRHGETQRPSIRTEHDQNESLQPRIKVELIVSDRQAEKAINVILRHAATDSDAHDGHVTLVNVDEVLQITQPNGTGPAL
jgi:nitrogen regulatory protein PII